MPSWLPVPLRDAAVRTPFLWWAAVGGFLRVLLLPVGISSDTLAVYWRAHLIAFHGEVYADYLVNMGSHLVHAVWLRVAQPFLGPADGLWTHPWWWADPWGLIPQHMTEFLARPDAWRAIALLKLPYALAEVVAGVLLLHVAWNRGATTEGPDRLVRAKRVWVFWMLSPAAIYATLLFARYEAFPVLAIVAALLLAERDRPWAAAIVLGIGITLRTYPIVLVPVFALVLQRGLVRQAAWTAAGLAPFALSMVANRLVAGAFGEVLSAGTSIYGSNWLDWTFAPGPGRGPEGLPLFPAAMLVLGLYLLGRDQGWWGARPVPREHLWRWVVLTHLVMFATTLFSAHYLMWVTPAIALLLARSDVRAVLPLHLVQVAGVFTAAFLLWGGILFTGTLGGLGPTAQRLLPLGPPLRDGQLPADIAWVTATVATLALLVPFLIETLRRDPGAHGVPRPGG
ncbi:MAG: hypothetical protein KY457_06765 [Actinobacteria bacterium]|nr:hypothetical protein [Actinomycetota bacterium]